MIQEKQPNPIQTIAQYEAQKQSFLSVLGSYMETTDENGNKWVTSPTGYELQYDSNGKIIDVTHILKNEEPTN